jgi:hypothetical protein
MNVYRVLVGEPQGKKLLGRHRHRWGDNIKIDLRISIVLTTCLCPSGLIEC